MLSLSMIVRNEEDCLEACLSSVKDLVDEMVVVDTGSEDATVSIANACGARVEYFPWTGDFAPARNAALSFVQGDWVLVLDADEQLLPKCIPELKAHMSREDCLLVNLLRYENEAAMSPYSKVSRLFRRHPMIRWSMPYHSMVDESVWTLIREQPEWKIIDCVEPALTHEGYQPELIKKGAKAERLRHAMETWLLSHSNDPYASAKLGALEVLEGHRDKGIQLLRKGLIQCEINKANENLRYELLFHLGIALAPLDPWEAVKAYSDALGLPLDERLKLGARLNLAMLLMDLGYLENAISLMTIATQSIPELALCWLNLGLLQRRMGDVEAALKSYGRAIELRPNYPEAYQNSAIAKFSSGDISGARENFRRAIFLLISQGRSNDAEALRNKLSGIVNFEAGD